MSELLPPPKVTGRDVIKALQKATINAWYEFDVERLDIEPPSFYALFDGNSTTYYIHDAVEICGNRIVTSFKLTRETERIHIQMVLDDAYLCRIYCNPADGSIDELIKTFKKLH